jgi:hypothetical protein
MLHLWNYIQEHFCCVIPAIAYLQILTLQAYLGDIAGSVSDHCNKASHTNFLVSQFIYESYVYTIL